jgi:hypothetical protein|nr:MAG TPA: hypothetical protein [Caudoviricetes sp.]DAT60763.1 MAG TPA: hypothetical protein [Bacteriophage sp.]
MERDIDMLSFKHVNDFISRLPIDTLPDFGDNVVSSGDLVECYAPDFNFSVLNTAIRSYNPYSSKIIDNGVDFVELNDTIYVDGLKVDVRYYVSKGAYGSGTIVKLVTDAVYSFVKGEYRTFSGFNTYNAFIEKFVV